MSTPPRMRGRAQTTHLIKNVMANSHSARISGACKESVLTTIHFTLDTVNWDEFSEGFTFYTDEVDCPRCRKTEEYYHISIGYYVSEANSIYKYEWMYDDTIVNEVNGETWILPYISDGRWCEAKTKKDHVYVHWTRPIE